MNTKEIIEAIKVGLSKPKLYKRSTWNKSVKVMEYLSDNTNGEVVRVSSWFGYEKYKTTVPVTDEQLAFWALSYKRGNALPISVKDALPELHRIARQLGVPVNDGSVLNEYYNRHPYK